MSARWIGLARPKRPRGIFIADAWRNTMDEALRACGVAGVLCAAAALNFALYPDALAAVVGGANPHVAAFADEPAPAPIILQPAEADPAQVRLLAATAWAEARSEGEEGMRAVAHVIVNRVGGRFGGNLQTVILAPKQFSAWNIGDPNRPLAQHPERYAASGANLETWETAQQVAREVLVGESVDPTDGALFYHARAIRPWWARFGSGRREIGAHVFYRDVTDRAPPPDAETVTMASAQPLPPLDETVGEAAAPQAAPLTQPPTQ